jgi:hypothetical protein
MSSRPGERSGIPDEIKPRESSDGPDLSATEANLRPPRIVFPRYGVSVFWGKFLI